MLKFNVSWNQVSIMIMVSLLILLFAEERALGEVSDTFDTGDGGWMVVAYPFRAHYPAPATHAVTYSSEFGNPPGSLSIGDEYGETGVSAPSQYLGDQSGYYGGTLKYDIYIRYTDGVVYPASVINAGAMSIYYDAPSPVINTWETRSIPLMEDGWRVSGTDVDVTPDQFLGVLSDIHGLYFYTEWNSGPDDTNFDNVRMTGPLTGVTPTTTPRSRVVSNFSNWPNPFNPSTVIAFDLASPSRINLRVFDVSGHLVLTIMDGQRLGTGRHVAIWNGRNDNGRHVASGNYFYRLEAEEFSETRKMTLLK